MGRVKDARPCLNVSAFFGGRTHRLIFGTAAAERREAGGDQCETAPPGLPSASSQGHGELLNELLSGVLQLNGSRVVRNCLILQPPLGAHAHSHSHVPE